MSNVMYRAPFVEITLLRCVFISTKSAVGVLQSPG
jgi:hypothetical protein